MMGFGSLRVTLTPTLFAAVEHPWISIVNPKAGGFKAPEIAGRVQQLVGKHQMSLCETLEKPQERIAKIVAAIARYQPNDTRPLGLLAYGGDRTVNDTVLAALHYIFPRLEDLYEQSVEQVVDRMFASGIRIGTVTVGTVSDVGSLFGAPGGDVEDILTYMDQAIHVPLNLGLLSFYDAANQCERSRIYSHNASAGMVIASAFAKTKDERGLKTRRLRWWAGLKSFARGDGFQVDWFHSRGQTGSHQVREVMAHATVRADSKNGFPGTPHQGLGIKMFPRGLWKVFWMFVDISSRGRSSLKGDPSRLLPSERLKHTDPALQPALEVGEEMAFIFRGRDMFPRLIPVQADGDYLAHSHWAKVRALPPFALFLAMPDSLMANREDLLITGGCERIRLEKAVGE